MRIRTIKPEFFKHDGIAALSPITRLLFIGLWSLADCEGRLEDRPARIRVEVLPYDDVDADGLLADLSRAGFIIRYKAEGVQLIEIPSFIRHQRITGKESETPSQFPKYVRGNTGETTGKQLGSNGETPETTGNGREGKGKEGEGKGKDGAGALDVSREKESAKIPENLLTEDFKAAWAQWLEHLRQKRKPATPHAQDLQLRKLSKMTPERAIETIKFCIEKNWQSIYEQPINSQTGGGNRPSSNRAPTGAELRSAGIPVVNGGKSLWELSQESKARESARISAENGLATGAAGV